MLVVASEMVRVRRRGIENEEPVHTANVNRAHTPGAFASRVRGELTSNLAQAGGFLKSEPSQPIPDLQWHIVPFIYSDHGQNLTPLFKHYAYTLMTCFLRPESRGTVRLASTGRSCSVAPTSSAYREAPMTGSSRDTGSRGTSTACTRLTASAFPPARGRAPVKA